MTSKIVLLAWNYPWVRAVYLILDQSLYNWFPRKIATLAKPDWLSHSQAGLTKCEVHIALISRLLPFCKLLTLTFCIWVTACNGSLTKVGLPVLLFFLYSRPTFFFFFAPIFFAPLSSFFASLSSFFAPLSSFFAPLVKRTWAFVASFPPSVPFQFVFRNLSQTI